MPPSVRTYMCHATPDVCQFPYDYSCLKGKELNMWS